MFLFSTLSLLFALPFVHSHDHHAHTHQIRRALPQTWYHERDHPVHEMFKRGNTDGANYPAVGTPAWTASYPAPVVSPLPDTSKLPAKWVSALNAAVVGGKIPAVPQSSNTPQTNPVYPAGTDPGSPQVCSATYKCITPGDIWNAPDGVFASSFDDGPTPMTPGLVDFLKGNNQKTTHFMIGVNILSYPTQFLSALQAGHDIAVHTWTHPYMTTLSNLDIVAQLGYTTQVIHDSTGGRVPRYWRPPYGDSDMRVRAIAKEVFGLDTVIWNHDTDDWAQNNTQPVIDNMTGFLASPKSPGLIILEHEVSNATVGGFIASYPMIAAGGWKFESLASVIGAGRVYQNAASSDSGDVVSQDIILPFVSVPPPTSSSTSTSSTASSAAVTTVFSTAVVATTTGDQSTTSSPTTSATSAALAGFRLDIMSSILLVVSTIVVLAS